MHGKLCGTTLVVSRKSAANQWVVTRICTLFSDNIPGFPVEYGTILHDRLASAIRCDGSHRYAHYAERIGRVSKGVVATELPVKAHSSFDFQNPTKKLLYMLGLCNIIILLQFLELQCQC